MGPDTEVLQNTIAPFGLRMQPALHAQIKAAAESNGRSMNSEIVSRLEDGGKTLRDEIAIAAMHALMVLHPAGRSVEGIAGGTASVAYDFADAMLAERQKGGV